MSDALGIKQMVEGAKRVRKHQRRLELLEELSQSENFEAFIVGSEPEASIKIPVSKELFAQFISQAKNEFEKKMEVYLQNPTVKETLESDG